MYKNSVKIKDFFIGRKTFLIVFLLLLIPMIGITSNAADYEDYSPILYFESEETCYPVTAQYHLDNSELKTDADTGITYYDNIIGTPNDDKIINDYKSKEKDLGYTVYYRVDDTSEAGVTVIQYWMFYAFNKGELNQHEGDWEMVEVIIRPNGIKEVGYSQHHSGQYATWNQVERDGKNIKIYVARGSHANYLRSFSGKLGIASDYVGDNGKVLKFGTGGNSYQLVELTSQDWIDDKALWGEYNGPQNSLLGLNGPPGPQFRGVDEGNQMWYGVSWSLSLIKANDMLFFGELFMYHFVTIFIILTVLSLAFAFFRIYRRHKKYGLGPRIISIFYIDGINLKSIGNILCFVGIILAIVGLFYPWYTLSGNVNAGDVVTGGMVDIISIDGINGFQMAIPGITGLMPMGSILIPFSLLIGISIVFLFSASIGISKSVKLGFKYIGKGIRFMIPIILIIIIIAALGSIITPMVQNMQGGEYATEMFSSISSSPLGGQETFVGEYGDTTGTIEAQWGLGLGGQLLIFSGIIMIIAGIMEFITNKTFFESKTFIGKPKKEKNKKVKKEEKQIFQEKKSGKELTKEEGKKVKFCPNCGETVEENEKFCGKCGEKI